MCTPYGVSLHGKLRNLCRNCALRVLGGVMATYRFSAKVISRSSGRSATAAAAYRAAMAITDERTGMTHDYSRRQGVVHAEILLPEGAPEWMGDRSALWNAVETAEKRRDAQLVREIQLSLPHELPADQREQLARDFAAQNFVSLGMVADLALHAPDDVSDDRNHHAHLMLTMRSVDHEGFGKKQRDWNDVALLEQWREQWAEHQNRALEQAGHDIRVDHRTLEAQGIDREPEPKLGPVATKMEREGRLSHAGDDLRAVWWRNAERALSADRSEALDMSLASERLQGAQDAREALPPVKHPLPSFDDAFAAERASIEQQCAQHQGQVDDLSEKLEGRGRFAVLWDKLRGRLGWNAEQELKTAQAALQANEERRTALETAQAVQTAKEEAQALQQRAALDRAAEQERRAVSSEHSLNDDWRRAVNEPVEPERSPAPTSPQLQNADQPPERETSDIERDAAADYAEMFRQARERAQDMDRER